MPVQRVCRHTGGSENYVTEQEHTKPQPYTAARHKAIQHAHMLNVLKRASPDRWPLSGAVSAAPPSRPPPPGRQGTGTCNNLTSSSTAQFTPKRPDTVFIILSSSAVGTPRRPLIFSSAPFGAAGDSVGAEMIPVQNSVGPQACKLSDEC